MFWGSICALVTPFKDGKVDDRAYQSLVDWQIREGTHALVAVGTTGESPTLSHDEHHRVVEACIEAAAGRVPVIAGTGSNATDEAIALTQHAQKAGAAAALVVTPYYNKPTQEGLYQHFKAIHDAADLPIIIYNIPPRCVVDMTVDTMARLAGLPRIIGVKDATADLVRPLKTRLRLGAGFRQFSGEDATVVAFLAQGGHGCISVTANVAPRLCADLHNAWARATAQEAGGDAAAPETALETVFALRDRLMPLHAALFVETNPAPVKYALSLLGKCDESVRQPLVPLQAASRAAVRAALVETGLLAAG